jgi:pimeloyl-ACP methyl ester carboxylesterase
MKSLTKRILWIGLIACGLIACSLSTNNKPKPLPERHGQLESQLFIGQGSNQKLIVGFGGSEGGNAWASDYWKPQRDKFLAQGYAFLAIGYFGTRNTPGQLDRISLDAIHNLIADTAKNPQINSGCIAVMGGSKGAELVLNLASFYPDYSAVIAIVPGSAVFPALTYPMNTSSFSYQGKELPYVPVPWSATPALIKRDLRTAFEKMMQNQQEMENTAIPVEKIRGSILLLSATQDEMWPSSVLRTIQN